MAASDQKEFILSNPKKAVLDQYRTELESISLTPQQIRLLQLDVSLDGMRRDGLQVLALPGSSLEHLFSHLPNLASCPDWARESLETEARYAVYLDRQKLDIARVEKDQGIAIPHDFDYSLLSGLSNELRVKLESIRPRTVAEASDIEGITPSALVLISAFLRRKGKNDGVTSYPRRGSSLQSSAS